MASRSFHALFLRARDHFAGSSHWLYLAVLALALIHALVVTPFIAGSRRSTETSLQRTRLATVESSLGELRGALEAVRQETSSMVAPALERLIEDLEHDLERLEATRRQVAALAALEAAPEEPEPDAEPATAEPPPPAPVESAAAPFAIDDADRIADLRDAASRAEMLAALAPLVDELIARPRFFDLQRSWNDEALPRLEARLDTAAAALPRLRSRFPEARDQWQALTGALTGVSGAARELRFEPPAEPYWWALPADDDAEVEIGLAAAVAGEIRRPRRLAELEQAADRSVESYSEIVGKVAQAQRELGEPPAGAFSGHPGGGQTGQREVTAVALFPLLVGWVLGGAVIWRGQRLRELGLSTRLAIEHGGPAALRQWLWSQFPWSAVAGTTAARAWHACVLQTLLGYFLAMSWIALAAVQLRQLEGAGRQRLMVTTIAGASVVLVAVVHRLIVARRAIMALEEGEALDDEAEEEADAEDRAALPEDIEIELPDAPEDDGELLGVRPLRR